MSNLHDQPRNRKNVRAKAAIVNKYEDEQDFHYFCVPFDAGPAAAYRARAKGYELVPEMSNELEQMFRIPMDMYLAAKAVNEQKANRMMPLKKDAKAKPGANGLAGTITEGFEETNDTISLNEAFGKSGDD